MSDMFNAFYEATGHYPFDEDDIEACTCDKCRDIVSELDLIWINAEGFMPLEDEEVIPEAYNLYEAVCGNCYGDIVTIKQGKGE